MKGKVFALVVALVLCMAMGVTAFAAGEGSITVTGQKVASGEETTTYEAYRIFDLTANADYTSLAYTINSAWTNFFTGSGAGASYIVATNDTSANDGAGYTPIVVDGTVKYIALTESNVAEFGKKALAYSTSASLSPTASNTDGSFSNLDLGYYMVYPKGANINVGDYTSIVSLTTTKPSASVVQKAEYPTLEKTDDDDSVQVGQTVTYTLTSKVPDTTGFDTFTFTMHDQMTDGLTFGGASSITVKIGESTIVPASGEKAYTFAEETPDSDYETAFSISIPVKDYQEHIGETITVTYTATVDSDAVAQVEKNKATLEYSNNPKDSSKKTTTPPDEEEVFTAKIVINKYDGTNSNAKLADAKFVLRCKTVTDTGDAAKAETGKYYKKAADGTVSWVAETAVDAKVTASNAALESDITSAATVVTTDENGAADFSGLENGEYELIEVAAPAGYNQVKGVAATVTVEGTSENTASLTVTADIENNSGAELPSTGGIGTSIFYVAGSILVRAAAILLVTKRRMSAND